MSTDELAVPVDGRVGQERADAGTWQEPPPLLRPRENGPAEAFASRVSPTSPVRVFLAAIVSGYVLLAGATIALGLLLTEVVLPGSDVQRWDTELSRWLAGERTPALVDASWVGSTLAGGLVIPVVVGTLLLVFCVRRQWLLAAVTLFLISVESGTYRATTLVVERPRPPVHRLESLPADASLPSGHTAASMALYGGLLLLCASHLRRRWFTWAAVALTIAIVAFVGWSRMLRGMHHASDTLVGVLVGLLAIVVTLFAARAATAASRRRHGMGRSST